MAEIKYIGVHHFGGPLLSLKQTSEVHRKRWPDFPSVLRPDLYVGYNFIIWPDGSWTQCRYIGEETAAQRGHNFDTVSICMAGDFTYKKPTLVQQETLRNFLKGLVAGKLDPQWAVLPETKISIPYTNIHPHRILQPNHTECYGRTLADDWARLLAFPKDEAPIPDPKPVPPPSTGPKEKEDAVLISLYKKLLDLLTQLLPFYARTGALRRRHACIEDVRG